ncbi:1,5-anhydro-D-fructose reductase [Polystyrenella longa]|uniref:1,5-anhydro-D-fructose reductase n=1 Tax=Polystyrenella longa TaxID=2528007 RepID=A0A518CQX3_9PLAN|nr:Gfo/Idh/MocA family oxidoreductase [Polystyrenella longa]QDU81632.1 1,5-anhydro-D-fructose reductase [Polystyrenella longa]
MNKPDLQLTEEDYLVRLPSGDFPAVGCIGAGFIMADFHLVAYRQAGLQPLAISSRNPTRAGEVAARHKIPTVYSNYEELLNDDRLEVIDIAVPPDIQLEVIEAAVQKSHIKGILAQKPLGMNYREAVRIVELCESAGITLAVNQNMRFDHSVRAAKCLLDREVLGEPVLATIDMRAIPHWMPWQERLGWLSLRIMSIHHLDTFRYWFGSPKRIYASVRSDPRTARNFAHEDGICLYILEYENGLRASSWDDVWAGPNEEAIQSAMQEAIGINWRIEGTAGLARGTIGWPKYPARVPSTLDYLSLSQPDAWQRPRWNEVWFPDAFIGPMAELLRAITTDSKCTLNGRDNLETMALVDAAYLSAQEHRAVEVSEITE